MKIKKIFQFFCIIISLHSCLFAQVPQAVKYQAAVRNTAGEVVFDSDVSFRISIVNQLPGHNSDTLYTETHTAHTNMAGVASLNIGMGSPTRGNFSTIDWTKGDFFLHVEIDINGGENYQAAGSSQILSVPFALSAGNVTLTSPDGSRYSLHVDDLGNLTAEYYAEPLVDKDGNVYKTVKIGTQVWMAENLRTGVMIHSKTGGDLGVGLSTDNGIIEKYCWENVEENCDSVGALYYFSETIDYDSTPGGQGICPEGWHVPTEADWDELISNFPEETAGLELSYKGTSGFNAVWTGYMYNGNFKNSQLSTNNERTWTSYYSLCLEPLGDWMHYKIFENSDSIGIQHIMMVAEYNESAVAIRCIKNKTE